MKRLPRMWRKKNRQGKQVGNWLAKVSGDEVNLGTKDAELARKHLREALGGRREFVDEIDAAAAALEDSGAAPAAAQSVQDPAPPAAQPVQHAAAPASPAAFAAPPPAAPASLAALPPIPPADPQDFEDTAAAAGEAAEAAASASPGGGGGPEGADPDVLDVTTEQLADLGVEAQVWVAAWQARRKIYTGFIPPPIPQEVRAPLAEKWKTILNYAGAAAVMPPWVTGLLIPGVVLVTSTFAMAAGYSAIAEEQRKAAGAPSQATESAAAS